MTAHHQCEESLPAGLLLGPAQDLGGSTRSTVHRHLLDAPHEWGRSVIVKRFLPQLPGANAAMGYDREYVALQHLPGAPSLLHADPQSQLLVLEDLGDHPTLADLLLGADPRWAWEGCLDWARALGGSLRSDPEVLAQARRGLVDALIQDRQVRAEYPVLGMRRLHELTGNRYASAAIAELSDLVEWLEQDSDRHVLGPGDACPDNALMTPEGVRLVDLEGAGIRHAAFEAAYAAEPFSTCWCVYAMPTLLPGKMLEAFTAAAEPALPGLGQDPHWPRQVRGAIALWVAASSIWLLEGAMADRDLRSGNRAARVQGPPMRALLMSRWRRVLRECADELPDTAAAFDAALTWAQRSWAGSPQLDELAAYPAWDSGTN